MNYDKDLKHVLSKTGKWVLSHTITVLSCVAIITLGIVIAAQANPGTTIIGEDITTTNLKVSSNATTSGNQTVSGNLDVSGTTTLANASTSDFLNVGGIANFLSNLSVSGTTSLATTSLSGNLNAGDNKINNISGLTFKDDVTFNTRDAFNFSYVGGYTGSNPVIATGTSGTWDDGGVREIGNVLYEPDAEDGYQYKHLYSGYSGDYSQASVYIGYAHSSDGKSWTKEGKVISRSLEDPYVVKVDGTYHLFAEDKAGGGDDIRKYHSTDLISWTDDGVVLQPGAAGSWEKDDVSSPVVWVEDGTWYILYEGRYPDNGRGSMGLATSSDGINWNKNSNNPVASPSTDIFWWSNAVVPDQILKIDGSYYLFAHSHAPSGWYPGIAVSSDLVNWYTYSNNYIAFQENNSQVYGSNIQPVFDGSEMKIYYPMSDDSGVSLGYPLPSVSRGITDQTVRGGTGIYVQRDISHSSWQAIDFAGSQLSLMGGAGNEIKFHDTGKIFIYDGTEKIAELSDSGYSWWKRTTSFLDGIRLAYTSVNSDYTTDQDSFVAVNATSTAPTITLATSDNKSGMVIIVKDISGGASSYNITIGTEGSATINGTSSVSITSDYGVKRLFSNGTNWFTY